jgi:hypothetical protein
VIWIIGIQAGMLVVLPALFLRHMHDQEQRARAAYDALLTLRLSEPQKQFLAPAPTRAATTPPPTDLKALNQVGQILRPVPDQEA